QMIRRPVEEYNAEQGPELYRGREWPKPEGPPLSLTFEEADAIPLVEYVSQPSVFVAEGIRAPVRQGPMERADRLVYQLLLDNPDRPVHFSRSAAEYPFQLGFGDRLVGYGLTRKL